DGGNPFRPHVPSTERPGPMRRIDEDIIRQLEQLSVQAVIKHPRQLHGSVTFREIRASHISQKQGVASQNSPGRGRLLLVRDHEAHALWGMARGLQSRNPHLADSQRETVPYGGVRKCGLSLFANINL